MCDKRDRRSREVEMSGVCCLNILCSGTVAARVDRVGSPDVLILCSVNLYNFPKIQKTQAQMLKPHYFCGFLVSSGPLEPQMAF